MIADAKNYRRLSRPVSPTMHPLYAIRDFLEFKTTWHPIGA
jgi:hypothetical protein